MEYVINREDKNSFHTHAKVDDEDLPVIKTDPKTRYKTIEYHIITEDNQLGNESAITDQSVNKWATTDQSETSLDKLVNNTSTSPDQSEYDTSLLYTSRDQILNQSSETSINKSISGAKIMSVIGYKDNTTKLGDQSNSLSENNNTSSETSRSFYKTWLSEQIHDIDSHARSEFEFEETKKRTLSNKHKGKYRKNIERKKGTPLKKTSTSHTALKKQSPSSVKRSYIDTKPTAPKLNITKKTRVEYFVEDRPDLSRVFWGTVNPHFHTPVLKADKNDIVKHIYDEAEGEKNKQQMPFEIHERKYNAEFTPAYRKKYFRPRVSHRNGRGFWRAISPSHYSKPVEAKPDDIVQQAYEQSKAESDRKALGEFLTMSVDQSPPQDTMMNSKRLNRFYSISWPIESRNHIPKSVADTNENTLEVRTKKHKSPDQTIKIHKKVTVAVKRHKKPDVAVKEHSKDVHSHHNNSMSFHLHISDPDKKNTLLGQNTDQILKVIKLTKLPQHSDQKFSSYIDDNIILDYSNRYKGKRKVVADFSQGADNARLLVYSLQGDKGNKEKIVETKRDKIEFLHHEVEKEESGAKRAVGKYIF